MNLSLKKLFNVFYRGLNRSTFSLLNSLGRCFSAFIKRQPNVFVFGARSGKYYMDNSRALFEYYLKHKTDYKVYWMANDNKLYRALRKENLPVVKQFSFFGWMLLYKASVAVYSNRLFDITVNPSAIPVELKLVMLGHGLPVKNYRLMVKEGIHASFKREVKKTASRIIFAISASTFLAEFDSKCTGIPLSKYKITGLPRNDWLFNPPTDTEHMIKYLSGSIDYKKIILYAPTWRMHGKITRLFPFNDFDSDNFVEFLNENEILFLLRPHLMDIQSDSFNFNLINKLTSKSSRIRLATSDVCADVNVLLPGINLLITDYSSIFLDFMLLNRPMVFIPYDYEDFEKRNGFLYDYFENIPGPTVNSYNELCNQIKQEDFSVTKRKRLIKKLHDYSDGGSSGRVAKTLEKFL